MTIGGWILFIIISIVICLIGSMIGASVGDDVKAAIIGGLIALIICVPIGILFSWWYANTESGKRAIKTQESNFQGGIERKVEVYDMNGSLIKSYQGKFDVDYNECRIIFDDEKGLRHIIYYPTGTVIIDEIGGEDGTN